MLQTLRMSTMNSNFLNYDEKSYYNTRIFLVWLDKDARYVEWCGFQSQKKKHYIIYFSVFTQKGFANNHS